MPIPTVLGFYTLKRENFFLTFYPKTQLFHLLTFRFPLNYYNANSTHCSPSQKLTIFRPDLPQTRLFDHLLKPKIYHFQDLRSSKVPLLGFERPDLLQISLFDHLLKPKMSHFQDLRSSKVPLLGFESPYLPLSGFEKLKISGEQTLKPLHLATTSSFYRPH